MAVKKKRRKAPPRPVIERQCARTIAGSKKRCTMSGTVYALSAWWCAAHQPLGSPNCGHDLGTDRCAWCGAPLMSAKDNGGIDPEFGVALSLEDA